MSRSRKNTNARERLLKEGMALLSEHGYHGTGLKKILDSVNIPKGSFYNYFNSKEAFVAELIKRYRTEATTNLNAYLETTKEDPITVIRNILTFMTLQFEKEGIKGCLVGNLAAEIGDASKICQREMQHAVAEWKMNFTKPIKKAQEENLIRNDLSAESLAEFFWCAWEGGLLKTKIDGNTAYLKEITSILLDSLLKPSQESKASLR